MNVKGCRGIAVLVSALTMCGPAAAGECVVLLHGLWRTENSMNRMEASLAEAGYRVVNVEYDSTSKSIEALAQEAVPEGLEGCGDAERIHFVTHSMGGILVRQYLEENDVAQLGRVVMLGPPNQGSEVIDSYADLPGFEWFSGPAGLQLGTGEASVPRALGSVHFELGVIAGTRSINPILSQSLPGPDDGKVSVDATRVEGMDDHLEMPVTHVFMMRDKEVIVQVRNYLANGHFRRTEGSGDSDASRAKRP
jgi:pimeloyl-ACP methyl ester carboxylesterase